MLRVWGRGGLRLGLRFSFRPPSGSLRRGRWWLRGCSEVRRGRLFWQYFPEARLALVAPWLAGADQKFAGRAGAGSQLSRAPLADPSDSHVVHLVRWVYAVVGRDLEGLGPARVAFDPGELLKRVSLLYVEPSNSRSPHP